MIQDFGKQKIGDLPTTEDDVVIQLNMIVYYVCKDKEGVCHVYTGTVVAVGPSVCRLDTAKAIKEVHNYCTHWSGRSAFNRCDRINSPLDREKKRKERNKRARKLRAIAKAQGNTP